MLLVLFQKILKFIVLNYSLEVNQVNNFKKKMIKLMKKLTNKMKTMINEKKKNQLMKKNIGFHKANELVLCTQEYMANQSLLII